MTDDAIREVLRSPLDDPPRRGSGWGGAILAFVLAAGAAFGAGVGIRGLAGGDGTPESTTTSAAASDETPEAASPIPLGDVQAEIAAAWNQNGHLFVVVTTVVPPGEGNQSVEGVASAHWVLRLPTGDSATAVAEHTNPAVPGLFTVEFLSAADSGAAQLLAYPVAEISEVTFPTQVPEAQLPWVGVPEGAPYRLGDEELIIDSLRLDDAGGEMTWHLGGASTSRAAVGAEATYLEVGGEAQAIVPEAGLPFASLVSVPALIPTARSGLVHLFHLDDAEQPSFRSRFFGDPERVVPVEDLTLEIAARLYRYRDEAAVLPLEMPPPAP